MNLLKNQNQGRKSEQILADKTGLEVTPGSGCGLLFKGDLNGENWLIESKSTRNGHLQIATSWWFKADQQAKQRNKPYIALTLSFTRRFEGYTGPLDAALVLNQHVPNLEAAAKHWDISGATKKVDQKWFELVTPGVKVLTRLQDRQKQTAQLAVISIHDLIELIHRTEHG